jgi:hypothetical protein
MLICRRKFAANWLHLGVDDRKIGKACLTMLLNWDDFRVHSGWQLWETIATLMPEWTVIPGKGALSFSQGLGFYARFGNGSIRLRSYQKWSLHNVTVPVMINITLFATLKLKPWVLKNMHFITEGVTKGRGFMPIVDKIIKFMLKLLAII